MARVVVVGASGHGRTVADALVQAGHTVVGFIDTNKAAGTAVDQWEVLGTEHELSALVGAHSLDGVVMGIGDNAVRVAVAARVSSQASANPLSGCEQFGVAEPRPSLLAGEGGTATESEVQLCQRRSHHNVPGAAFE